LEVRILKLKAFARFQRRERITDAALVKAAADAGGDGELLEVGDGGAEQEGT
jgi:hypothetical protein